MQLYIYNQLDSNTLKANYFLHRAMNKMLAKV